MRLSKVIASCDPNESCNSAIPVCFHVGKNISGSLQSESCSLFLCGIWQIKLSLLGGQLALLCLLFRIVGFSAESADQGLEAYSLKSWSLKLHSLCCLVLWRSGERVGFRRRGVEVQSRGRENYSRNLAGRLQTFYHATSGNDHFF